MGYYAIALAADRGDGVRDYLDVLRHEQARFLDAMGEARSLLDGSCRLARATAIHTQLTRRFFDAQRAILRRRAEHEAALALAAGSGDYEDYEVCELDEAQPARQLAALLDDWWRAENHNGRVEIDAVRTHADLHPPSAEMRYDPPRDLSRPAQLSSDIVAALDAADPADLRSLMVPLEGLLEPGSVEASHAEDVRLEGRHVDGDVIIWLAPEPIGLRPIGASWLR